MKEIIMLCLLVLLTGCHTTPVQQPTNEQKIEESEDTTLILSDILQLFKWRPDEN